MKKFVVATVCTFALVGYVLADEFGANITKVDGNKITYFKTVAGKGGKGGKGGGFGGGKKDGDAITGNAAASVKVVKGVFDMDSKGFKAGDAIEGGLKADMFKSIDDTKGVNCRITIADDGADKGKITQIMIIGGKKKGG